MDVPRSAKTSRPRPVSSARLRLLSGAPAAVASRTGAASSPVRPNARLQPLAERRSATAGGSGGALARVRAHNTAPRGRRRRRRPRPAAQRVGPRPAPPRRLQSHSIPFSTSSHHGPRAAPAPPRGWPGARPPARPPSTFSAPAGPPRGPRVRVTRRARSRSQGCSCPQAAGRTRRPIARALVCSSRALVLCP